MNMLADSRKFLFFKRSGKNIFCGEIFYINFCSTIDSGICFPYSAICLPISGICLRKLQKSLLGTWQQWLLYLNMFAKAERMRTPATRNTVQNRMVITMNTQFHLNKTNFGVLKSTLS